MKPTREQIGAEITALKEIKPTVRRFNFFDDDNHRAIEVQISVLENNYSSNLIYGNWRDNDFLVNAALEARDWLDGNSSEPPSVGWKELAA